MAAFRRAAAVFSSAGTDGGVELDAMLAAPLDLPWNRTSRPAVVHHDDVLGRTNDGNGSVVRTQLAVLARLDAGSWYAPRFSSERVPTLGDAIAVIAGAGLQLICEIKPAMGLEQNSAAACIAVLHARWPRLAPPPIIASFSVPSLYEVRRRAPQLPIALNLERLRPGWQNVARDLGCVSLHVDRRSLDRSAIAAIRHTGVRAVAWTVNSPMEAVRLYRAGICAIISDDPRRLLPAARKWAAAAPM